MAATKTYKVYGRTGHRQKESFNASYMYDFSGEQGTRIIEVFNSDLTGTNDYTVVRITRNTENECFDEIEGQLSDGIFENMGTGAVVEFDECDFPSLKEGKNERKLYKVYANCAIAAEPIEEINEALRVDVINDVVTELVNYHFEMADLSEYEDEDGDIADDVMNAILNEYTSQINDQVWHDLRNGYSVDCGDFQIVYADEKPKRPNVCGWGLYNLEISKSNLRLYGLEINKSNLRWYALQTGTDDDWGTGTFSKQEAIEKLKSNDSYQLISVIQNDVCIEEIHKEDI